MPWINTINVEKSNLKQFKGTCLIVPVFESKTLPDDLKEFDNTNGNILSKLYKNKTFKGKSNSCQALIPIQKDLDVFILTGLGTKEKLNFASIRDAIGLAIKEAKKYSQTTVSILDTFSKDIREKVSKTAKYAGAAIALSSYEFIEYNKEKKKKYKNIDSVNFLVSATIDQWKEGLAEGLAIAEGSNLARDLGNHPGNIATPTFLANTAKSIAKSGNMGFSVFGRKELEKMKMGAFAGVAQGSTEEPKLIVLEYNGGEKSDKPIALVGKGLTFDSGGISLKPGPGMEDMKFDMLGGAAVLGIMKTISILKPKINIIAIVPSTENMPGGSALKPGDIITAYNKKTIEVLNTDAEGRLILADALAYVSEKYSPRLIFDFATLTGAVLIALGHEATGIMGTDESVINKLKKAGDKSGERVWQLPLYEEFSESIKSQVADVKNIGPARLAGSAVAGAFLKEFVGKNIPWVHFDIAGTGWVDKDKAITPKGPSGVGPMLIMEFLNEF